MILVDTPVWSLALRRRRRDLGTAERRHVHEWERLVDEGAATLLGPIRQELLSGVREEGSWERLRTALRPFPDLPIATEDFERVARFFNRCRARRIAGSAVDLLIHSISLRDADLYDRLGLQALCLGAGPEAPHPAHEKKGTEGIANNPSVPPSVLQIIRQSLLK